MMDRTRLAFSPSSCLVWIAALIPCIQAGPKFKSYNTNDCSGGAQVFMLQAVPSAAAGLGTCLDLAAPFPGHMTGTLKFVCFPSGNFDVIRWAGAGCTGGGGPQTITAMSQTQLSPLMAGTCVQDAGGTKSFNFDTSIAANAHPCPAAGVGGDPVTYFGGMEHKFTMPTGQLTVLLKTKELTILASAFPGNAAGEQWLERIAVDSADGERVLDVSVRRDLEKFQRENEIPGAFESIEVKAPWKSDKLLPFPWENKIVWGSWWVSQESLGYQNISMELLRAQIPDGYTYDAARPNREGILIRCDTVKVVIMSASAFEYYYDDADDSRALQYAHLDFDVWDMDQPSSFTGLLPEVWGLIPKTNEAEWSYVTPPQAAMSKQESQALKRSILATVFHADKSPPPPPSGARTAPSMDAAAAQKLKIEILSSIWRPSKSSEGEKTDASVCSGLQCSRPPSEVVV